MKRLLPVFVFVAAIVFYFAIRMTPGKREIKPSAVEQSPLYPTAIPSNPKPIRSETADSQISASSDEQSVSNQIAALTEASLQSDSKSFQLIVGALRDERQEIRQSAVEAAIQFGSRDAIPFLEEAAAKTDDAREKVELLDAIDFLKLPPLSEVRSLRRTNAE